MKNAELIRVETSNQVYNRALKKYRENNGLIHCGYCRYHKGENFTNRDNRCWKNHRKHQYK